MKIRLFIAIVGLFISTSMFAQTEIIYSRVELPVGQDDFELLSEFGVDFECGATIDTDETGRTSLTLELNQEEIRLLENAGLSPRVLIEDVSRYYAERNVADLPLARAQVLAMEASGNTTNYRLQNELITNVGQYSGNEEIDWAKPSNFFPGGTLGSQGGYYTLKEVYDELDAMRAAYPNLISARTAASTTHTTRLGNVVYYVRISDNPDTDENEPESLLNGNMHAREGMSVMNIIYHMWYLLENYSTDPAVKNLVDNHEMYFMPITNPDGYAWNQATNPNSGGMQRKNLRNVNLNSVNYDINNFEITSGAFTTSQGVDMNRNWGAGWGFNGSCGGSSGTTSSATYRGSSAMSEPEAQAIREFMLDHNVQLCMNHHSYKDALLHAYAGAFQYLTGFEDQYYAYSQEMSRYNRYVHGSSTEISYQNAGNTNDWMITQGTGPNYNDGNHIQTMSWTPENGNLSEGGFWPSSTNIIPIAKRAMRMNFMAHYLSGKYAKLHDLTSESLTGTTGQIRFSLERLGRTDSDYTLTITPKSNGLTFTNNTVTISNPGMLSFTDVVFNYELAPWAPAGTYMEYDIRLENDDYTLYEATLSKVFQPTALFADDFEGASNWTASGLGWVTTATEGVGGSNGVQVEKQASGVYYNGDEGYYTLDNPIDLSGTDVAIIQFDARWDLERNFDYVQLQASTNGTTWTGLTGKYTKVGTDVNAANNTFGCSGCSAPGCRKSTADKTTQPQGEPMWDGYTWGEWFREEIVLDNYFGGPNAVGTSTLYLRFVFESDSNNPGDAYDQTTNGASLSGFTFDNFQVISADATILPVELVSFQAESSDNATVDLTWETASEENNKGFEIQRSVDGMTWTNIGFVDGNGTTSVSSSYDYTDVSPLSGSNYYRLKQVDFDGRYEFSEIRRVDIFGSLTVSNRTNAIANIGLGERMSFEYQVINTNGVVVQIGQEEQAIGNVDVDLSGLPNGIYYLRIVSDDSKVNQSFPIHKVN